MGLAGSGWLKTLGLLGAFISTRIVPPCLGILITTFVTVFCGYVAYWHNCVSVLPACAIAGVIFELPFFFSIGKQAEQDTLSTPVMYTEDKTEHWPYFVSRFDLLTSLLWHSQIGP